MHTPNDFFESFSNTDQLLKQTTAMSDTQSTQTIFYGEKTCEAKFKSGAKKGQNCKNGAYYSVKAADGSMQYLCGTHSGGKMRDLRVKLPKNPKC